MQCLDRTSLRTPLAQNAFRCILALTGVVANLYIHRASFKALATFDALTLITADAKSREIAHRLEEYCNRTNVFTECPIVLK